MSQSVANLSNLSKLVGLIATCLYFICILLFKGKYKYLYLIYKYLEFRFKDNVNVSFTFCPFFRAKQEKEPDGVGSLLLLYTKIFPYRFSSLLLIFSLRHFSLKTHTILYVFFFRSEEHTSELQSRQYLV